jgi:HSP20 family protein
MAKKDTKQDISVAKQDKQTKKATTSGALTPIEEMDREMERMFRRFGHHGWMRPFHWGGPFWGQMPLPFEGKVPSVDVIERDEEILVRAELPGVDKKDLEVTLSDTALTIGGSTKTEEKEEKGDYYRREMSTGSFSRTVGLPSEVDGDKVQSSFKDGVLELTLPKVKKTKKQRIEVE